METKTREELINIYLDTMAPPYYSKENYEENKYHAEKYADQKMAEQEAAKKKLFSEAGGTGKSQYDLTTPGFMGFSAPPLRKGGLRRRKSRKLKSRRRRVKSRRF
jgi:hypothetical protein